MKLTEQQLLTELADLPREIDPPAGLWPGIQSRLQVASEAKSQAEVARGRTASWIAVAAVLVAAVSGTLGYLVGQSGTYETAEQLASQSYSEPGAALIHAQGLEQEFLGAWREFNPAQTMPAAVWSGETRADFKRNLELIELATEQIREALAQDPDSMYLADLLETTYQQQMAFMRSLMLQASAMSPVNISDTEMQERSLL